MTEFLSDALCTVKIVYEPTTGFRAFVPCTLLTAGPRWSAAEVLAELGQRIDERLESPEG